MMYIYFYFYLILFYSDCDANTLQDVTETRFCSKDMRNPPPTSSFSKKTENLMILSHFSVVDGKEMSHNLKRTCRVIVLLIKNLSFRPLPSCFALGLSPAKAMAISAKTIFSFAVCFHGKRSEREDLVMCIWSLRWLSANDCFLSDFILRECIGSCFPAPFS